MKPYFNNYLPFIIKQAKKKWYQNFMKPLLTRSDLDLHYSHGQRLYLT